MGSIGGPPEPVIFCALRNALLSAFSRRFAARASSFRRFWNLVFDRLANGFSS